MSISTIRKLLESHLADMSPSLATAWQNVTYKPAVGTPYQRAFLLPGDTENPVFGNDEHREVGLLQVSLYYPENAGSGAVEARAELVRSHFPRGTVLTEGPVRLMIQHTPSLSPAVPDGGFYVLHVSIFYVADVNF